MNTADLLIIVAYFTIVAFVCCMTFVFVPLRAAGAYRTGSRSRASYVARLLLTLTVWACLSLTAFYVPFFERSGGFVRGWGTLLMAGSAGAYYLSGKYLLHLVSRRELTRRRLQPSVALRAR